MVLHQRPTEMRNPRTTDIDLWSTEQMITALFAEDQQAVEAARLTVEQLADAVDRAHECLSHGGVIHYFGAGASGRLAVADATEATPTFGAPRGMFNAHFPGGAAAIVDSQQDFEDESDRGRQDAESVTSLDMVLGITASGSTAYVAGALTRARERGAATALITNNPQARIEHLADIVVVALTGPEAITGSTRLKAGTATKVTLNAFSTALMVRAGRTYSNLMVDLVVTNEKLERRAIDVLALATAATDEECRRALSVSDGELPVALIHLISGRRAADARAALARAGSVRAALAQLEGDPEDDLEC